MYLAQAPRTGPERAAEEKLLSTTGSSGSNRSSPFEDQAVRAEQFRFQLEQSRQPTLLTARDKTRGPRLSFDIRAPLSRLI